MASKFNKKHLESSFVKSPKNNRLLISFSGGETSAFMTIELLKRRHEWDEVIVVFANTAQEREETLEFVDRCDRHYGFNVVWVEAVINPGIGDGVSHKVVSFETADRKGEPFEAMIRKYGIPSQSFPHCSRVLKREAMESYAKSIGWRKRGKKINYETAIGIRADEFDRMSSEAESQKLIYPLVKMGVDKPFINRFWEKQPFRLELKGYEGNCKWCWKKSLRKLLTIASENPGAFDFPLAMEEKYGDVKIPHKPNYPTPATFFRKHMSASEILALSKEPFVPAKDDKLVTVSYHQEVLPLFNLDTDFDQSMGCESSCEAF